MAPELEKGLQELLERQAILDCIHRHCRGVDRMDRQLTLSAYHPDAIDDRGAFIGNPDEFVYWAFGYHFMATIAPNPTRSRLAAISTASRNAQTCGRLPLACVYRKRSTN
jgi:hypothetical protein